jgi:hypothetical protein
VKELVEKLMGALPFFARRFVALLGGPKSAVLALDLESDSALEEAFTFLAVSFGITFIAGIPFLLERQDKELFFGVLAVQSALSFVLNVALVAAAWKMVGAKLTWKKVVAVSCYFCGVSTILCLLFWLVGAGVFKIMDGVGYKQFMSGVVVDSAGLMNSAGLKSFFVFAVLGILATYVWIVCVWGAYRELMQVSKGKSAVALVLFTVLSPLLFAVQIAMGMTATQSNQSPAMPTDLAGQWALEQQSDSGGAHSTRSVLYSFSAPKSKMETLGYYELKDTRASANGKCLITVVKEEFGTAHVQDPTIDLIPAKRTDSRTDECTGRTNEAALDLRTTEYRYKINKDASGWTLCLNDRFGDTCLTPKKQ